MASHITAKREGTQIILPDGMGYDTAIEALERMRDHEEQEIAVSEVVVGHPLDALHAFKLAIERTYGVVLQGQTPGFFGPKPPRMVEVQTSVATSVYCPMGRIVLPTMPSARMNLTFVEGALCWQGTIKRKDEKEVMNLLNLARKIVREESIYKGKAIRVNFESEVPEIAFVDITGPEAVFSEVTQKAVDTSILTPIRLTADCRRLGIPLKRGILLSGTYGVGKTLLAVNVAREAQANGWTYVSIETVSQLAEAVRFAKGYGPCVLFCEDIDRAISGDRSAEMDDVLNVIDGVESKGSELMIILTTNDVSAINQAMLRPGRLDAVIDVTLPDAGAREKLVRQYAKDMLSKEDDLSAVVKCLEGMIPAVIREVVERAKLTAVKNGRGLYLLAVDILESAESMQGQLALLNRKKEDGGSVQSRLGESVQESVKDVLNNGFKEKLLEDVRDIVQDVIENQ